MVLLEIGLLWVFGLELIEEDDEVAVEFEIRRSGPGFVWGLTFRACD
jgi:hypothetical protein